MKTTLRYSEPFTQRNDQNDSDIEMGNQSSVHLQTSSAKLISQEESKELELSVSSKSSGDVSNHEDVPFDDNDEVESVIARIDHRVSRT